MIIESIEMDNFKSFGHKRKVEFRKGLTVISGPNGSGKSNIGDALLFVLGVRSAKSVRADRLSDLIHRSSEDGPGRRYCRVQINIDSGENGDGQENRKISIMRELTADGDDYKSNYYINGSRVKHSDVEQLLDSLKIYLDGYSFVLQGDINNLVKMTGVERRKLLEAISGVESYDNQIQKAQADILGINDHMIKLDVRTQDEQRRVEELRHDKETAERYLSITNRILDLRSTLMDREISRYNMEIGSLNTQIYELDSQVAKLEAENSVISGRITELLEKRLKIEGQRAAISGQELNQVRKAIEQLRLDIATRRMQIQNIGVKVGEKQLRIQKNESDISRLEEQRKNFEVKLKTNNDDMDQITREIKELDGKLSSIKGRNEASSGKLKELKERYSALDEIVERMSVEVGDLEVDLGEINNRKIAKTIELSSLEEKKNSMEFQIKDSVWRSKESESIAAEERRKLKDLTDGYYSLKSEVHDLTSEREGLQKKLIDLNREYSKINAMAQNQRFTQNKAISLIMGARNQNLIPGIHGTLKDLISFDEEFRTAVEATAGNRLNSVVVESDETSQKCIELLKREKAGRITFLPVNKMTLGRPRGKAIIVHNSQDSLGYVMERIRYDPRYEGCVWHGFQDTVIVENVEIARKYMVGVKLVTLDGDIFDPSGAITGGFIEKRHENVVSEKKAADISSEISVTNSRIDELSSIIKVKNSELDRLTEELSARSREEGQKRARSDSIDGDITKTRAELEQIKGRITICIQELGSVTEEYEKKNGQIQQVKTEMRLKQREKTAIMEEMKTQNPEEAELQESIERKLSQLREQQTQISSEISATSVEIRHTADRCNALLKESKDLETEIKMLEEEEKSINAGQRALESDLSKTQLVEAELDKNTREYTEAISKLDSEISKLNLSIETNRSMCVTKKDVMITLNSKVSNIREKAQQLSEELTNSGGKPIEGNSSDQEIRKSILVLQGEGETLGPINYKAIEEFSSASSVLDTLRGELQRFTDERKELEGLMEKLNKQKETIFVKTFSSINEGMNLIYGKLSGGGEAQLLLSDPEKPLESEVHIKARPKGKTFAKLQSLSGGEKSLTALAFIMSVQRITPSPVYYLDEVDMFLDGSNVERMGQMFRANSETSQILMVSLKKAMLKYANNIIGVTSFDQENTEVYGKTISPDTEEF